MKKFRPASRRGNKGMFAAKEAASPNKQNLRLQNRARAALKRKKDAIIKKMKELESSTGYTGFFILQSPNEKHVIHGATNGLMQERFEKGEPLMEKETVIRSSCVMRKDADTFFSNINKRVKESNGVASHAPLPSPSKMPHCLKDLAGEQRSSLETIRVVANSNESQTPPVIKRKTTQKKRR